MATVPKDLGRQIAWDWTKLVWALNLSVSFGNALDVIYEIREFQLKPGVRDALAKSN